MLRQTVCESYRKHRHPAKNRQTWLVRSADNLQLYNVHLTTMKRALTQWTRTPAGAKRRRVRKRRNTLRADLDVAET